MHLLKSKALIDNFDFLAGKEKYKMTRNLFAISLFMDNKKINTEVIDNKINEHFGKNTVKNIKENLVEKDFLNKYKSSYNRIFNKILDGIKNGSKQK